MYISSTRNEELIWRYVPWIMEKDQALAVRVKNISWIKYAKFSISLSLRTSSIFLDIQ